MSPSFARNALGIALGITLSAAAALTHAQTAPPEQREAARERLKSMTPAAREKAKARWEAMSPEEREAARKRMAEKRPRLQERMAAKPSAAASSPK